MTHATPTLVRPEGCTCQYVTGTPVWYDSLRTCPLHHEAYDASQTPQWWLDGEARGWRAPRRSLAYRLVNLARRHGVTL